VCKRVIIVATVGTVIVCENRIVIERERERERKCVRVSVCLCVRVCVCVCVCVYACLWKSE